MSVMKHSAFWISMWLPFTSIRPVGQNTTIDLSQTFCRDAAVEGVIPMIPTS